MSLFKFLKPLSDRLPTAEETSLPENAVRSANNAVQNMQRKRKYTTTFTAEDRAKVGKYAAENGVAKAQRHFKQLNLSESTIRYFRKRYLNELSKRVKAGDSTEVTQLDVAKRGRKLALGETLDAEVKRYIQRLRENGTAVSVSLVLPAAEGYLLGRDRTVLNKLEHFWMMIRQKIHSWTYITILIDVEMYV